MTTFLDPTTCPSLDLFLRKRKEALIPNGRRTRLGFLLSLAVAVFLSLGANRSCVAQTTSPFYWDAGLGGLVDTSTGLVWGFGASGIGEYYGTVYTYDGAILHAGADYADTQYGYGFADWFVPTKDQMLAASSKGLYHALEDEARVLGLDGGDPEFYLWPVYWASDPTFKDKGSTKAYIVDIQGGTARATGYLNGNLALVARWIVPPPPPPPSGPGKGKPK